MSWCEAGISPRFMKEEYVGTHTISMLPCPAFQAVVKPEQVQPRIVYELGSKRYTF